MHELIYHKGRMLLPESFEECSGKQFIQLAQLIFTGGDEIRCKVRALKILCGLSPFRFAFLKPQVINNTLPFIEWVFDREKNITKQLMPSYKGYHGPTSDFDNLIMKEFHMTERNFQLIAKEDGDVEAALNNLVAVLYRLPKKGYDTQKDPDGDIRIKFNHNEVPYYSKKIARWPLAVKQAIFLWYAGCRKELEDNNPLVFKEDGSSDFISQFDTGMYGVMQSLAGEKLGKVDGIEEMYVHTAMLNIGLIKEQEKYYESKMKTA